MGARIWNGDEDVASPFRAVDRRLAAQRRQDDRMATDHDVSGNHPVHPVMLSIKEHMAPIPQLDRLVALAGSLGALVDAADGAGDAFRTRVHYPRVFGDFVERHAFVAFDVGGVRVYSNIQGAEDGLEELWADKILTRELVNAGFLPFGRPATGSYDRICFDVRGTQDPDDAPVVLMDHEAILSKNRMPKPKRLADGLMDLVDRER